MLNDAADIISCAARYMPVEVDDWLLLLAEEETHLLEGRVYIEIARACAAAASQEDLNAALLAKYSRGEIVSAVTALEQIGFLRLDRPQGPRGAAAFWESVAVPQARRRLAWQALCDQGQGTLRQCLQTSGLVLDDNAPLLLVTTDDYLRPELAEIDRQARPWMLAKPVGHSIWLGPVFVPGKTACWGCLAAALKANRWRQAAIYGWSEQDYPPQPSIAALPATLALAAGLIATTAAIWAARGEYGDLEDTILVLDSGTLRQARSPVRRRADCRICGGHKPVREGPPNLRSFVSPISGIVSRVRTSSNRVAGLFHAEAAYVQPLPQPGSRPLLKPLQAYGKGLTQEEAELNCLAEALERHSSTFRGNETQVRGTLSQLDAISPDRILLFSEGQYRRRDEWNQTHAEMQWVAEPFGPVQEICWTPARSLVTGETKYVPAGACFMWYPFAKEPEYCSPDSNGCAAGPDLEAAIVNGLLELIERDAVAIWWYNRLVRPAVDMRSFAHPGIQRIAEAFRAMEREVYLLDLTTDLAIPAFVALAPRPDGSEVYFGAAAHVTGSVAAWKAVSELAQIYFWSKYSQPSPDLAEWVATSSTRQQPYLAPGSLTAAPPEQYITSSETLSLCTSRLAAAGIEPVYVDLTRGDIGVPVVRVIAPGLRHFWARFAPGRLYDVPVRMGWLREPMAEEALNPVACML